MSISRIAPLMFLSAMACTSGPVPIPLNRPGDADILGKARGEACGSKVVSMPGAMALDFMPIMLNSRLDRATADAVASVPGATRLTNVAIEETWFYWVLGMTRCVIVTGDATK